ncbi:MAG: 3-hydroxyacyl-ACP dehydratase FabZ family protein [Bdellovibrionota bacterium]
MISDRPELTLPHRDPFLWVSRLMERNETGEEGVVEFDVDAKLDLFRGHFPDRPIFPGVLQLEAGAQACMWVFMGVLKGGSIREGLFVAVDSYKFKYPVLPGDTLRIHCKKLRYKAGLHNWSVEMKSKDDSILYSKGNFWMKLGAAS